MGRHKWLDAGLGPSEPAPALPLSDGQRHVLQPLLVGLGGTDLRDDRAQQFVHQLQNLVSILSKILKLRK